MEENSICKNINIIYGLATTNLKPTPKSHAFSLSQREGEGKGFGIFQPFNFSMFLFFK